MTESNYKEYVNNPTGQNEVVNGCPMIYETEGVGRGEPGEHTKGQKNGENGTYTIASREDITIPADNNIGKIDDGVIIYIDTEGKIIGKIGENNREAQL